MNKAKAVVIETVANGFSVRLIAECQEETQNMFGGSEHRHDTTTYVFHTVADVVSFLAKNLTPLDSVGNKDTIQ
jgi:hypothetical protein